MGKVRGEREDGARGEGGGGRSRGRRWRTVARKWEKLKEGPSDCMRIKRVSRGV